MRASGIVGRGRRVAWVLALPVVLLATGCDDEGDTIVVNGLDCGLIREDLVGQWSVTFVPAEAFLQNCDDNGDSDGTRVDVAGGTTVYPSVFAFASLSGASFDIVGSTAVPEVSKELFGSVEADSCLALIQKWEGDDGGWVQCFGTLDRRARAVAALCDSMDLNTDLDPNNPEVACDLDRTLTAQILTP